MEKKNILWIVVSLLCIAVGCIIPPPEGLTVEAMRFAGVFVAALILLISKAVPDWAGLLFCCCMLVCLKVGSVATVFSAFSGSTWWLIVMVFAFAAALGSTGLLKRIALKILGIFPATYNGAVLALMTAGVIFMKVK